MNEVFIVGKVIEISPFKFIIYKEPKDDKDEQDIKQGEILKKHQSVIKMKIEHEKGEILKVIAYDRKAEYVLRNDFQDKVVFINGTVSSETKPNRKEINVIIKSISAL